MKLKKILAIMMALAMSTVAMTGCSNEKKDDASKEKGAENSGAQVVDGNEVATGEKTYDKVLKMATNAAFPPYEYKEGEEFAGIDVEIAQAIAEELGCELEIVDMEFDSIIASVQNGETDFGMAGMTVTDERKEEVDFTFSYATGVQVVIVQKIQQLHQLMTLKVRRLVFS